MKEKQNLKAQLDERLRQLEACKQELNRTFITQNNELGQEPTETVSNLTSKFSKALKIKLQRMAEKEVEKLIKESG